MASLRWSRILRELGHRVRLASSYDGRPADLMVAIHAWRSAEAIERFKARYPGRPVVLQLSGTDIYEYLRSDPGPTLRSMELADWLIGLNDLAATAVPRRLRTKLRIIFQSATPPTQTRRPSNRAVIVAVIGHLRDVKDPLRAAAAARLLPAESRIRIEQVGRPLDLYNRPANRFVAGFIGSPRMNFVNATIDEVDASGLSITAAGLPPLTLALAPGDARPGDKVTIGVRPEHLASGGADGWPLSVEVIEQLGGMSFIHGVLPSGEKLVIVEPGQTQVRGGDAIVVRVDPRRVQLFGAQQGEPAFASLP